MASDDGCEAVKNRYPKGLPKAFIAIRLSRNFTDTTLALCKPRRYISRRLPDVAGVRCAYITRRTFRCENTASETR